jgi:Fe-S-cluster-containing dehydrogenase component
MKLLDIRTYEHGKGSDMSVAYVPVTCNNCEQAPCVRASRDGAVYKREDGIVMIDPERAKGQKAICSTCPYGHIWWNEEEQVPQLWTFDAHLLDRGWDKPRMVDACPTLAIEAVKTTAKDMEARVKNQNLQTLIPEYRTKPRIYYKNLDSALKEFIAGSVLSIKDGRMDAMEGVEVHLFKEGTELSITTTNFFGDFKFRGLDAKGTQYVVRVQPEGQSAQEVSVTLSASVRIANLIYTL